MTHTIPRSIQSPQQRLQRTGVGVQARGILGHGHMHRLPSLSIDLCPVPKNRVGRRHRNSICTSQREDVRRRRLKTCARLKKPLGGVFHGLGKRHGWGPPRCQKLVEAMADLGIPRSLDSKFSPDGRLLGRDWVFRGRAGSWEARLRGGALESPSNRRSLRFARRRACPRAQAIFARPKCVGRGSKQVVTS